MFILLGLGEEVLITVEVDNDNYHSAVFRVWPISIENQELPYALHLTSSAAKNLDLGEIDLHCVRITLESWTHPKTSAKQISLRSRKVENEKYLNELSFQSVAALARRDSFLKVGSSLSINYYGKGIDLVISEVLDYEETTTEHKWQIDDLAEHFKQSASLSNVLNPKITSTPVKVKSGDITGQIWHYIGEKTKLVFQYDRMEQSKNTDQEKQILSRIGGLQDEIRRIKEAVNLVLMSQVLSYKGILLFGPSGTGKTLLGRSLPYILEGETGDFEFVQHGRK